MWNTHVHISMYWKRYLRKYVWLNRNRSAYVCNCLEKNLHTNLKLLNQTFVENKTRTPHTSLSKSHITMLYLLQPPCKNFPMLWFWSLPSVHRSLSFTIAKYSCMIKSYIFMLFLWCSDPGLISFKHKLTSDLTLQDCWACLQKLCILGRQASLAYRNYTILLGNLYLSIKKCTIMYVNPALMVETMQNISSAQKLRNALS